MVSVCMIMNNKTLVSQRLTMKGRKLSAMHITLQEINISHLGKRKIIFKIPFLGDMLVPWRVYLLSTLPHTGGNCIAKNEWLGGTP